MNLMVAAEFLITAAVGVLFWRKGLQKRFPALNIFLCLKVAAAPVFAVLILLQSHSTGRSLFHIYFYTYWSVYIASALVILFVCKEIFCTALAAFPGLVRLGAIAFNWAAVISVVLSLSTVDWWKHGSLRYISVVAFNLMRSVSILELSLLAFLCVSMNAFRLSVRDLSFGLSLGFGVLAANDFIAALFLPRNVALTDPLQFALEGCTLVGLCVFGVYFVLPEPERKPVIVAASSTVFRWNEIASALGHTGTRVAVQEASSGFFLSDVERVVEKVLARNMQQNTQGS